MPHKEDHVTLCVVFDPLWCVVAEPHHEVEYVTIPRRETHEVKLLIVPIVVGVPMCSSYVVGGKGVVDRPKLGFVLQRELCVVHVMVSFLQRDGRW